MRRSEHGGGVSRYSRHEVPSAGLEDRPEGPDMKPGDILEILGDCPTFKRDVLTWCKALDKAVLSVKDEGGDKKRIQIQF